jgi:glycosyltransferase involved in cell wall biosynthesis
MSKKILIVDSGLKNLGGHNYSYTNAVRTALSERGYDVDVFANRALEEGLARESGFRRVFSYGAYDFPPGKSRLNDLSVLYERSAVYADDLARAFEQHKTEDYALVFCHTVNDFELIGWNRFLSRNSFQGHLMILQRQTPGFTACSGWKTRLHPFWRIKPQYLKAIRAKLGDRFVLVTDSEPLSMDFARIYRSRITTLPIPINGIADSQGHALAASNGICERYGLVRDGRISVGYMGDARESKGFFLLPELIRRIPADVMENLRFVIQCPPAASGPDNGSPAPGYAELKAQALETGEGVKLIPERLSEADYAELLGNLDVVLIPYCHENYATATSGIFAEALALSKPVVVPTGTWMASELRKSGGGVEFKMGSAEDLTAGVVETIARYDELKAKASQFKPSWNAFHNAGTLADMLLKECNLPARASL